MEQQATQETRLRQLVELFKADSGSYRHLDTPRDAEGQRRLLRSLMNIRMPGPLDEAALCLQDEYLRARAREKGVVTLGDIPTVAEAYQSKTPHADRLSLWQGDITRLAVDAIVNAANEEMLGCFVPMHSCIDNCIHTFAGVQLRNECARQMARLRAEHGPGYTQPTAVPLLTEGFNLPARNVIHIVGPIVEGRLTKALEKDLEACYTNTLDLCAERGLRSVAFCCVSTGVFRFPNRRAAQIAVDATQSWLARHEGRMDRIIFNVFKDEDKHHYETLLR